MASYVISNSLEFCMDFIRRVMYITTEVDYHVDRNEPYSSVAIGYTQHSQL